MGVDIADINNDALPDIMVVDMLPDDYERQKKMLGFNNYNKYLLSQRNQYTPQYVRNTLQMHNGLLNNQLIPTSEVSHQAGISKTDWSWAPLIADFDADGHKDIYITNGYVKDITDLDFINYSGQNNIFGSPQAKQEKLKEFVDELPGIFLPNVFYKNNGDVSFNDYSGIWMTKKKSFSNGAAYADLDKDGDLDLIVNNINNEAFILKNHSDTKDNSYVQLKLKSHSKNKNALGSKVILWQENIPQVQYQTTVRGYLSSVEPLLHFGVKKEVPIDSLQIIWQDGTSQTLKQIKRDTTYVITHSSTNFEPRASKFPPLFKEDTLTVHYKHQKMPGNDFTIQPLIPHQFNASGPIMIASNIDSKLGEELFIGGNTRIPSQLFSETKNGNYVVSQSFDNPSAVTAAVFIDIDNDQDKDLYIGYGGTGTEPLQDIIYVNDHGIFTKDITKLPDFNINTSQVDAYDYDQDGDTDLFVAAGVLGGSYPLGQESYLLENDKGIFKIATTLSTQGFLKDCLWADLTGDHKKELIVIGEWTSVKAYKVDKGSLVPLDLEFKNTLGQSITTQGWWNTIASADIDNDGDQDLLLGNQGTNGFIKPVFQRPVYVYTKDFDQNKSVDPVLGQYFLYGKDTILKPVHTRDDIVQQIPILKKRFNTYSDFAKTDYQTLLNIKNIEEETLQATIFHSVYVENLGEGNFVIHELPSFCQRAPINDFLIEDVDEDGYQDVIAVGNDYTAEANYGIQTALPGIYLKGEPHGFQLIKNEKSGFVIPKQSNNIITLKNSNNKKFIIASQHNENIKVFSTQSPMNEN